MKVLFRKATFKDYNFCHDLAKENMEYLVIKHWGSWNSNLYKESFNVDCTYIVILEGKKIGFFRVNKDFSYIEDIQLLKEFQGRGYGREILEYIEYEAKKRGVNSIKLSVFKDNTAKNFYEHLNFKIVEDKGESLVYEKEL